MKPFFLHLKQNWIKYGLETLVVITGILIAFTLSEWGNSRKDQAKAAQLRINLRSELSVISGYISQKIYGMQNQIDLMHYVMSSEDISMDSVHKLSRNLTSRRDSAFYTEKHPINFLVTYILYYDPRTDVYYTSINDGTLALLDDLNINRVLSTVYTSHPAQIEKYLLTETAINESLREHISTNYQELFKKGTWDSPGWWDESTTYNFLKAISTDMKLKFLFAEKIRLLRTKSGTLAGSENRAIQFAQQKLKAEE